MKIISIRLNDKELEKIETIKKIFKKLTNIELDTSSVIKSAINELYNNLTDRKEDNTTNGFFIDQDEWE